MFFTVQVYTEEDRSRFGDFTDYETSRGLYWIPLNSDDFSRIHLLTQQSGVYATSRFVLSAQAHELEQYSLFWAPIREESRRGVEMQNDVVDYAPACPYADSHDSRICLTKSVQRQKISVAETQALKHDIAYLALAPGVTAIIISRRFASELVELGVTGARLVPCLNYGRTYSPDQRLLESTDTALIDEATHFQVLTYGNLPAQTVSEILPVRPRGWDLRDVPFERCTECGVAFDFLAAKIEPFDPSAFASDDFQLGGRYRLAGGLEFESGFRPLVWSSRVLSRFLAGQFTGLLNYSDQPLVRFSPVEVKELCRQVN